MYYSIKTEQTSDSSKTRLPSCEKLSEVTACLQRAVARLSAVRTPPYATIDASATSDGMRIALHAEGLE